MELFKKSQLHTNEHFMFFSSFTVFILTLVAIAFNMVMLSILMHTLHVLIGSIDEYHSYKKHFVKSVKKELKD